MSDNSIQWMTPGGMFIPENARLAEGEPCLLALKGGRSHLGQLLHFDPASTRIQIRTNQQPDPIELSHSYVQWMRLLEPVHLVKAGSHEPFSDSEWHKLLKPVDIRFKSGDTLTGEAPALLQTENGWFFFLVKQTAEVYRYFIPHRGVEDVRLNGELQIRLDPSAPVVREMKNQRLAEILKDQPQKYPYVLETLYGRVLTRIMSLWDEPERLQEYFEELMVDKRGGRQGFPADAAHDIFVLSNVYDDYLSRPVEEDVDPWAREQAKQDLELQGYEFTPQRFHSAVERNLFDAAELYVKAGMDVDTPGEAGWTPLLVATFNGNEAIAELLLGRGANPFATDGAGYTPLHWSAFNGFIRVTQILIGKRVGIDAINRYGWTPLLQAAARGHTEVCTMLIDAGARATVSDKEGWTPLHKAVANKHMEVVELLLAQGADVRAEHQSGVTPIKLASDKGYTEIYQRLLRAFAETPQNQDGSMQFKK